MSVPNNSAPPVPASSTDPVPEEINLDQTDFMDNSNFALEQQVVLPADPPASPSFVVKYLKIVGLIFGVLLLVIIALVVLTNTSSQKPPPAPITPLSQAATTVESRLAVVTDLSEKLVLPAHSPLLEGLVSL